MDFAFRGGPKGSGLPLVDGREMEGDQVPGVLVWDSTSLIDMVLVSCMSKTFGTFVHILQHYCESILLLPEALSSCKSLRWLWA
jgi:hypothetical protein